MSDTQHKTRSPVDLKARRSHAAAQWLLESPEDKNVPIHHHNELSLYICGEEAFAQIAADIKRAKSSVDIICWGFDPAMELIRTGAAWPRGETWGGLVRDVAAGRYNGGRPVQVRILAWYDYAGHLATHNLPGYKQTTAYDLDEAVGRSMAAALMPGADLALPPPPEPNDPKDKRQVFNARWYEQVVNGALKGVTFRTRDGNQQAVSASLGAEPGDRDWSENSSLIHMATDHQKTVLIDYEHDGGADAVGYVMGLNSVTDYWDTQQHLFNDPRRGAAWEGDGDGNHPHLKPYQDYACRIRGEALVAVSKNFTDAWNRAGGKGERLARAHDLHSPPPGLTKKLEGRPQRAQIVRTQPEESDKSIKRLYRQAASFARHYIYIENQYFQHTEWVKELKECRKKYVDGWKAGGRQFGELPSLHLFVVIPTPERAQMVPRTYDTVKALGFGSSMPNQDKAVEAELRRHTEWDAYVSSMRARGAFPDPDLYPGDLSTIAKSAQAVGRGSELPRELSALGIKALVASLWTFDHDWQVTQKKELDRLDVWVNATNSLRSSPIKDPARHLKKSRYREIYIHSKLMIIDDAMFTLGSANLNLRSMAVDAELNVASDDARCSGELRRQVWRLHTGSYEGCNPSSLDEAAMSLAMGKWGWLMYQNSESTVRGDAATGFLFLFSDDRTSRIRLA